MKASATGNAESVAEHAIFLLLALARRFPLANQALRQGSAWAQPQGTALLGKVACIVGLGDIGTALAVQLRAFGMRLVGVRQDVTKGGPEGVQVFGADALDEAAFAAMKPGALLVNIARGGLVKTEPLEAALR